jgi:Na+/H+ antiporter NhaD/arsenite permease-like protein
MLTSTDDPTEQLANMANIIVASILFAFVALNFLFPCNRFIPLDRRTTSVCGALLCYVTRTYYLHVVDEDDKSFMLEAIDFNVLILLSSIMIINHLVVHLKETRAVILYLQNLVKDDPTTGFWMVSLSAFCISPFLTNDGVCLLFVEPILNAFDDCIEAEPSEGEEGANEVTATSSPINSEAKDLANKLETGDCVYFLLALACSSNIGSSLTYTGNPQNMIVADDSIEVLPSYKFFIYMMLPAVSSWLITTMWIQRCWLKKKAENAKEREATGYNPLNSDTEHLIIDTVAASSSSEVKSSVPALDLSFCSCVQDSSAGVFSPGSSLKSPKSPITPRRKRKKQNEQLMSNIVHVVSSPFPYMVLILLGIMIIMIFVDVMPIASLICVFAMVMVICVVMGNHWRNQKVWTVYNMDGTIPVVSGPSHGTSDMGKLASLEQTQAATGTVAASQAQETPLKTEEFLTREEKTANLQEFFEVLFSSLDYSLLIIFVGLFVTVANMEATGLPKVLWNQIVGNKPFKTFSSIAGISVFVLVVSQFLGNVAVIQLAVPNVTYLDDNSKRLAWSIISFVATVGGNLTITGSAANIIVAEKAARLDPNMSIDFFQHYRVCFWITVFCCTMGGAILFGISTLDNMSGSHW